MFQNNMMSHWLPYWQAAVLLNQLVKQGGSNTFFTYIFICIFTYTNTHMCIYTPCNIYRYMNIFTANVKRNVFLCRQTERHYRILVALCSFYLLQ